MKKIVMHPEYGRIIYEENIWTGKKSLAVNGKCLKKGRKNVFTLEDGENTLYVTLKGNALTGVTATIQGQDIVILPKLSGLDYILCLLPFALIMIWGNSQALCSIIPVVGGAIGGGLSGLAGVLCVSMMREKTTGQKIFISLLATVITFLICAAIGFIIVLSMLSGTI